MSATASQASAESVRAFVQEYFDAWKGTDENKILAYYADNVVIHLPTGILERKPAVRDNFVHPFVAGFPGNVHSVRNRRERVSAQATGPVSGAQVQTSPG